MTRRWFALGIVTLAVLVVGIDGTVLALATPFISRDLHTTGTEILWIADIYSFVLAGLLISMGGLGDRIGHRRLLLFGALAFAGVSAMNAYAPSPELLIAGRALQGVAGAVLAPSTLALIRGMFDDQRERSLAVGIWAAAFSAGAALGPLLGGALLEHFWWGSVFLINVPVMAALLVGGWFLLPEHRDPDPGPRDVPSVLASITGMIAVVYAIKHAATGDFTIMTWAAAVVGVVALTGFVMRQLRLPKPLIDVRLFANRAFSGVIATNLLSVMGLTGLMFFLAQYFQLVKGFGPLTAGLAELPTAVTATVVGVLAGLAMRWFTPRVVLTAGLALVGVAMAALTPIQPDSSYLPLGAALFVLGFGLGLAFTAASDIILNIVPKERAGAAAAVSETAYELGAALGIALLGSIVTAVYRHFPAPEAIPAVAARRARDSLGVAVETAAKLPEAQAEALLVAARDAFTAGLAIAAGVGAALLLVSTAVVWILLRDMRFADLPGEPEVGVLADPDVHGDAGGDAGVDAAGRPELCDRHH
ncbi:major facilitator transporter [Mycolicibacterium phlei]|jgi:DHA2 family multidrug resistance protein-like MFS transporter|uniref:MFS transporter n=1 Tax=Mycolicibacterium phlei DSM 43239 = CCUG 21000 TaxID=1226750 RepID=A0A5N5VFU9_MYCPH|nr:MFS transporter [Mycolicibacterium phlei]VEG11556.1 major facilitator transporter [Mycobacteroides chelonae]AMO63462.1 Antiseptic resistance protein [Mycolicibacterium phlei]EID14523.1 major facilitator transporter [Mycolicibacterium phlei RIVM601174]KAB7759687.1 MFS transporter [Mycolicibacterium phlei DSM 43239 = CCUG 21000]KXW62510.1 MFS transporter [Mycolicibacterium phlei DSM 43070]